MLDHVGLDVADYERSKAFYEKALAPLGLELMMEPAPGVGGFGDGRRPFFWIGTGRRSEPNGGRRSTRSTPRRSRRGGPTTAHPGCARSTTRTTTAPTCSTPMGTTSRRSAIGPSEPSPLDPVEPDINVGELADAALVEDVRDHLDHEALRVPPERYPADDQDALRDALHDHALAGAIESG